MPEKESHASAGRVRTCGVYIRKSPYKSSLLERCSVGKTSRSARPEQLCGVRVILRKVLRNRFAKLNCFGGHFQRGVSRDRRTPDILDAAMSG
jgi:hypothetical protein